MGGLLDPPNTRANLDFNEAALREISDIPEQHSYSQANTVARAAVDQKNTPLPLPKLTVLARYFNVAFAKAAGGAAATEVSKVR